VRFYTENHNKMLFFEVLHAMWPLKFHFTAIKPLIFPNTGIFVATLGTCEGLLTCTTVQIFIIIFWLFLKFPPFSSFFLSFPPFFFIFPPFFPRFLLGLFLFFQLQKKRKKRSLARYELVEEMLSFYPNRAQKKLQKCKKPKTTKTTFLIFSPYFVLHCHRGYVYTKFGDPQLIRTELHFWNPKYFKNTISKNATKNASAHLWVGFSHKNATLIQEFEPLLSDTETFESWVNVAELN